MTQQATTPGITHHDGRIVGPLRRSVNQAQEAENSIHNDAVASKLGFRGGTVAGSIHLELFPPLLIDAFGERWLERGSLSINFRNPTTDREAVRASLSAPVATTDVQVDARIEREDGLLVGEGTASVGDAEEPSALHAIDLARFAAESPRILAGVNAGDDIPPADVHMSRKAQDDRLDVITEVLDCYTDPSRWGGIVAGPGTLVHYLYAHPAATVGEGAGRAVGLFGAIEVRHVNGPLLLDRTYTVSGKVLSVGESPKTEYVWFDSFADDADGTRVAAMRMQLRFMKASAPQYRA